MAKDLLPLAFVQFLCLCVLCDFLNTLFNNSAASFESTHAIVKKHSFWNKQFRLQNAQNTQKRTPVNTHSMLMCQTAMLPGNRLTA